MKKGILLCGLISFLTVSVWAQDYPYANQDGLTVYAQAENASGGEPISKLIDGSPLTKWLDFNPTSWVVFVYPVPVAWNKYEIVSGNDAPERDPMDWILSGSNDSIDWVILDDKTGQYWDARNVSYSYSFTNSTAYKYYKWDILANGSGNLIQVSELTFFSLLAKGESSEQDAVGNLTDNDLYSYWADNSTSSWVSVTYFPGVVWNKYEITSADEAADKDPKDWTFKGSNNGTDWKVIDTQTSQKFSKRGETKTYLFNNSTPFIYYKWDISANNGNAQNVQAAEFKMSFASRLNIYAQGGTEPDNLIEKLIDKSFHTDWVDLSSTSWVVFSYPEPHVWNKYEITQGLSTSSLIENDPTAWTISGSNDSIEWTTLDTQENQIFELRQIAYPYEFSNSTSYKYYKWKITANNGGPQISVSEFLFLGDEEATVITANVENGVNVYPNPIANVLNLTSQVDKISIYSLEGRLISTATKVQSINVSYLKSGSYIAKIENEGQHVNKIVIKK